MGGGVTKPINSTNSTTTTANNNNIVSNNIYEIWTNEEKVENQLCIELQKYAVDFIIEHIYYRIPIKCSKKSIDPKSPVYIEIDPEYINNGNESIKSPSKSNNNNNNNNSHNGSNNNEYVMDDRTKLSVPSGILITSSGDISMDFIYSNINYKFNVEEIKKTKLLALNYLNNPYKPSPPFCIDKTINSLKIRWLLPESPGIVKEIELEYTQDLSVYNDIVELPKTIEEYNNENNDLNIENKENKLKNKLLFKSNKWHSLVSKTYDMSSFMFYNFENLLPGNKYILRMRYRNFISWSVYSNPSIIIETLPDIPNIPEVPIIDLLSYDSIQLKWLPPNNNGSEIIEYILRCRKNGENEFKIIYNGLDLKYLVMYLEPECPYSFDICARNKIGYSIFSKMITVITPIKMKIKEHLDARLLAGYNCKEAWRELWDPKTEQIFYFNQLTGTRQLELPEILKNNNDNNNDNNNKDGKQINNNNNNNNKLNNVEIKFRMKRYRFVRALHKQKQFIESTCNRSTSPTPNNNNNNNNNKLRVPNTSPVPSSQGSRSITNRINNNNNNNNNGILLETTINSANIKKDILVLELKRETFLYDAYKQFHNILLIDLYKRLKVTFIGEAGIDSGGLTKEMFLLLSKEICIYAGPNNRRWLKCINSDGQLFFTNPNDILKIPPPIDRTSSQNKIIWYADGTSGIRDNNNNNNNNNIEKEKEKEQEEKENIKSNILPLIKLSTIESLKLFDQMKLKHQDFAHFIGRFIGKALFDRQMIDMPLSSLLLRRMLGITDIDNNQLDKIKNSKELLLEKLEELQMIDLATYNSLKWMLNNNITDILYETFTVIVNGKEIPLCKDGDKLDVTENNKEEYIKLLLEWKTNYSVSELLHPFLLGFHEIVPLSILKECELTTIELDLMLNGKPTIDVDEIRAYCIFQGTKESEWNDNSEVIEWLWRILRNSDEEIKRLYLKFVTGTSRVPLDGYDPPFNITEGIDMLPNSLPKAHTCFNQLVLPDYTTYEIMKEKLLFAITNTEGFELT